jgi:hypothetical protein
MENRCKKSPDQPNINMDCDKNRSENHNNHFSYIQKGRCSSNNSSNKGHTGATEGKRKGVNESLCVVRQKKEVEMPLASNSTSSYQIWKES